MLTEQVDPLISFSIATLPANTWGPPLIQQLLVSLEEEVPPEQEDAFWVDVTLTPRKHNIELTDKARFLRHVNAALAQDLRYWRCEDVHRQHGGMGGLVGVLLLMNTASLQDIMRIGAKV
jgi:hypothetical protein